MEWICNNWFLVVAGIALLLVGIRAVYMMYASPSSEQLEKVREWLLYACALAEQELGSGTGQLKLRYVYDLFLEKFPWLAKLLTFEVFSSMVDNSLEEMKHLITTNVRVNEFIESGN